MPVQTRSQKKRALKKEEYESENDSDYKWSINNNNKLRGNDIGINPQKSKKKSKVKKTETKCKTIKSKTIKSKITKPKRKLSDKALEDEYISTPPNKKKKTKKCIKKPDTSSKPDTPSKDLAKLMCKKLNIMEEEEEEKKDSDKKIISLQEKLLTQEINYKLIGRENEYDKIYKFIDNQLLLNQGNSFYICGSPGTGKTATIECIMNYFKNNKNIKKYKKIKKINFIKINGMSLNNPSLIYNLIYKKIFNKSTNINAISAKNKLEKYFLSSSSSLNKNNEIYIIIIDEMDGLLGNSSQSVLYHLFGWTKQINCKLILFGIANSIDLTDRFLPRLKQRNFEPELLIFKSYTKQQLIDIIKYRIGHKNINIYFDDIAINLCATKVAKMYGDVRKCLEICRNALNLLLSTNKKNKEKIGFIEMKQILSSSFESPMIDIIKNLPNHQKTIIVLSTILNKKNNKEKKYIIYNKLEQFYQFMSKKYILPKTSSKEFNIIIDSLITDNIFKIIEKKKK